MAHPDTLGGIGELATLDRIFPRLPHAASAILGPGDDCAVVAAPDGRVVITTDMMIHGPDFRLAWSMPHDLGWKAAATNLSDIAAMGAVPTALVVAIAAPESTPVTDLEGIADGFRDACATLAPSCGVVGGDLSVSPTLTIAVTALGDLEGRAAVTRSGARPGDVVAVSGTLGAAARGLSLLFERGTLRGEPDATAAGAVRSEHPAAVDAQLAPTPPIADGRIAAIAGATAMIDLSDGLALDAARVARASDIRIDLHSSLLLDVGGARIEAGRPSSDELDSDGLDSDEPEPDEPDSDSDKPEPDSLPLARALGGGEDHSLLATFPPGVALPGGFRLVGEVAEGEGLTIDTIPWTGDTGWDPYRGWDGAAG